MRPSYKLQNIRVLHRFLKSVEKGTTWYHLTRIKRRGGEGFNTATTKEMLYYLLKKGIITSTKQQVPRHRVLHTLTEKGQLLLNLSTQMVALLEDDG